MNGSEKRVMIRKYFKPFPKWTIVVIVIGVPLLAAYGLGIILIGIGILGIVLHGKGKPTDQQMDEWLEEDLKVLDGQALGKLGVDESELVGEPVMITGPRLWDVAGADNLFKRGKDNILRYTPHGVSIINFTENQLLTYTCALDFTTGKALNESTDEYFYRDVVSVSTRTESTTLLTGVQLNAAETFTLTTSGGTSVSVLLRDPTLISRMGGGEIPITHAEKAIQTVRKMLREKKTS